MNDIRDMSYYLPYDVKHVYEVMYAMYDMHVQDVYDAMNVMYDVYAIACY